MKILSKKAFKEARDYDSILNWDADNHGKDNCASGPQKQVQIALTTQAFKQNRACTRLSLSTQYRIPRYVLFPNCNEKNDDKQEKYLCLGQVEDDFRRSIE